MTFLSLNSADTHSQYGDWIVNVGRQKLTLAGVVLDGHAASLELGCLRGGRNVGEGNTLGESVASLERSHPDLI